jgi:hypothetical protein
MVTTRHAPPNDQHRIGFPALENRSGPERWDAASHAVGSSEQHKKSGRIDKLRERRARQSSLSSERRGSFNPPPPTIPPPPSHARTLSQISLESNPQGTKTSQLQSHHDEQSSFKTQQPPLPQPRRNSMTNQSTFEALVAASDFAIPRNDIPELHSRFQELEASLANRGLVVPPSNLLRNLVSSTNETGTDHIKYKRRQSDAGATTKSAPAPPPYQELLQKKPARLPPPPNGLQRDPSARSLTEVRQRIKQAGPPPPQTVAPPAVLSRSGSNHSTGSTRSKILIARGDSNRAVSGPAKFRDKLYAVLEARNRDNVLQHKHTVASLKQKIEAMEAKMSEKNDILLTQRTQLSEAEARVHATEERLEQQLTEAIATNEQLQALQLTVEAKDWEYKESTRRSRLRTDAAVDTLRSLVQSHSQPKLPDMLEALKSRVCSMVRAETADIYILDRGNSELISYRARVKVRSHLHLSRCVVSGLC